MSWDKSVKEIKWYDNMEVEKYEYTVGPAGEEFFNRLKQGKIIGSKCPKCGKVYVPARLYCEDCFIKTDYVEIDKNSAYVDSYTVIYKDEDHQLEKPIYVAMIKFPNTIGGLLCYAERSIKIGDKVKIVSFDWPLKVE